MLTLPATDEALITINEIPKIPTVTWLIVFPLISCCSNKQHASLNQIRTGGIKLDTCSKHLHNRDGCLHPNVDSQIWIAIFNLS